MNTYKRPLEVRILADERIKKYVSDDAHLMAEWDWEKNNESELNPHQITYGSAVMVYWKCSSGHSWQASPNHRSRGRNCPICARIIRAKSHSANWLSTKGSLAELNPTLAAEWHPTRNYPLTPHDVTPGNGRKAWWLCSRGHEWDAVISSRNAGCGCPYCSNRKLLVGFNDLATINPTVASQWHPAKNGNLSPMDVTANNQKKVWWLCEKGHEWEARIANRNHGCNCPICSGKQVLHGYNDLATVHPEIAAQWHPTRNGTHTPEQFTAMSNKKAWWVCKKGHEWIAAISHRSNGRGCPECSNEARTSFPEQTILFYLGQVTTALNRYHLDARTEIDVYLPEYRIGIEYDGLFYHSSEASFLREQKKKTKLLKNGIILIQVKETKLPQVNRPDEHLFYLPPGPSDNALNHLIGLLILHINSLTDLSFHADINVARDRIRILEQYHINEKNNSLAMRNPLLACQWHPTKNGTLKPEYVTVYSNKKVWWLCEKGHEWEAVINSRKDGVGCPYCAGKRAIPGKTDLATVNPKLAAQWHPNKNGMLKPTDVTEKSNKRVWWLCEKGHEWEAVIGSRSKGIGCPICAKERRKNTLLQK